MNPMHPRHMLAPIVMDIASQALPMAGLDNARRPMMRYEPGVEPGESEVSKIMVVLW
jgi:hypothetical protein